LNPQQPEPQSGALPLSYDHHENGEKEGSASSGSAKHIFRGSRGHGGPTFSTSFRPVRIHCNSRPDQLLLGVDLQ
jgi:hypothetical protein